MTGWMEDPKVEIWVKGGSNLAKKDWNGKSDPYVLVYLDDVLLMQTKVVWANLNPVWNEKWGVTLKKHHTELKFVVMDKDNLSKDDLIGKATVELVDLVGSSVRHDRTLVLKDGIKEAGYLHVGLSLKQS